MKKIQSSRSEVCLRCGKPITRDGQTCRMWGRVRGLCGWRGPRFPCVPRSDNTVIKADGLLVKTGEDANPVPILDDPYGE